MLVTLPRWLIGHKKTEQSVATVMLGTNLAIDWKGDSGAG
jgi:hypothetical protein